MIAALALLAAVEAALPPAAEPAEAPIVVIGRKLDNWRGRMERRRGNYVCRTLKSSGDKAIDAIGCQATLTCFAPMHPEVEALVALKLPKDEQKRRLQALIDGRVPCVKTTRGDLIAELAEKRAGT